MQVSSAVESTFEKVRRFAKRHSMLGATGIVVAVSGGPDSVALLDILRRLVALAEKESKTRPRMSARRQGCPIHIAHLDHMLRPRESADDAEFVRGLGERLEIPVTVSAIDVRAAAEGAGRGIEDMAREIRYTFLKAVARESGFDRIAVGHTMTDQAETVLMRLIRGAGLKGLAAMRPVSAAPLFPRRSDGDGEWETGFGGEVSAFCNRAASSPSLLIRPLLCITREEVEAYCRERHLEFRIDTTNASVDYTRSRIRNEVLPALRRINPQAVHAIARAAENAASDQDALDAVTCIALSEARLETGVGVSSLDGEVANAYSVMALLGQPAGVRRRAIIDAIRLARLEGGAEVTSTHVSAVEGLLESEQSGKHVTLPGSLDVWREFDALVFKPVSRDSGATPAHRGINAAHPSVEAGRFTVTLERGVPGHELNSVIADARQKKQRSKRDWMVVALDDQLLPEHLVIRPRLKGERAHVVGQRKTKKLKNLMIDHRIPSSRRADWPVVTTPDGGYIWSPGLPPSLKFAATDETQSLAVLRASLI